MISVHHSDVLKIVSKGTQQTLPKKNIYLKLTRVPQNDRRGSSSLQVNS
jgi:hypothetical protein